MLAQFLTGLQELTGWSFSVLMGGPSPENGGKVKACSLHVGVTNLGSMFDQAYPDFNNGIMWPYKDFLDCVSGEWVHCRGALFGMLRFCPIQH